MAWTETTHKEYRRSTDRYESDLTDAEWRLIEALLPAASSRGRPRSVDLRAVVDAIMYQLMTSCQWRALPRCFPAVSTVRYYFYGWRNGSVYGAIVEALRGPTRALEGRKEYATAAVIDSQSVATTASGGASGYDAGKKVKGRKRHVAVDTIGLPIATVVHTADIQDRDGALAVIAALTKVMPSVEKLFADSAYGGPKLALALAAMGRAPDLEIVKKHEGQQGFEVLSRRWVVERFFGWLGRCRRLAKDYERSLESSLAWLQLAIIRIMVRRLGRAENRRESLCY